MAVYIFLIVSRIFRTFDLVPSLVFPYATNSLA
jgi:hypothetical protein